eukprot:1149195-Pelagomonas_calceolata.AAC.1
MQHDHHPCALATRAITFACMRQAPLRLRAITFACMQHDHHPGKARPLSEPNRALGDPFAEGNAPCLEASSQTA